MSSARPDPDRLASPWWAHPATGLALFALPGAVLAFTTPPDRFFQMWGAAKYVGLGDLMRAFGAVIAFALGTAWWRFAERRPDRPRGDVDDQRVRTAFRVLSGIAFAGYAAWALVGLRRGVDVGQIRAALPGGGGPPYVLKGLLAPVGGVTTLTQTAPVAGGLAGLLFRRGQGRSVLVPLVSLGALSLARGYFLAERLAILELALPFALVWQLAPGRRRKRLWTFLFPFLLMALSAVFFSVFEYNRSWAYYKNVTDESYTTFARDRFLGYYTTPTNNAALLLHQDLRPRVHPFTLQWLDQLPILGHIVDLYSDRTAFTDLLTGAGIPDFNTEGALNAVAIDWGPAGSLLFWFSGGAALSFVFERQRRGDLAYLPLYASAYIGIVESGRYFYWGQGRALVPLVAGVVTARYLGASCRSHTSTSACTATATSASPGSPGGPARPTPRAGV